jgi:hypothetical protein
MSKEFKPLIRSVLSFVGDVWLNAAMSLVISLRISVFDRRSFQRCTSIQIATEKHFGKSTGKLKQISL